jgi:hypothetical protein
MARGRGARLMGTEFDYDLNIFKREAVVGIDKDNDNATIWGYIDPWYIHIYEVEPGGHREYGEPIELTPTEANNLIENDPYFQDHEPDLWYGLNGFIADKDALLSDRLRSIFYGLPVYHEEVLF